MPDSSSQAKVSVFDVLRARRCADRNRRYGKLKPQSDWRAEPPLTPHRNLSSRPRRRGRSETVQSRAQPQTGGESCGCRNKPSQDEVAGVAFKRRGGKSRRTYDDWTPGHIMWTQVKTTRTRPTPEAGQPGPRVGRTGSNKTQTKTAEMDDPRPELAV